MPIPARSIPSIFCWTRFGTEAGEPIEAILARKEAERVAGDGVFYWGIGNAIASALGELVARVEVPEVLFSPIRSRPRRADLAPTRVVRWTRAEGLRGGAFELPPQALITSRWDPARPAAPHYALVCSIAEPLELADLGRLRFCSLRNLRSGAPVGASQVTAVVRKTGSGGSSREYRVALRATLVAPYLLRLHGPAAALREHEVPSAALGVRSQGTGTSDLWDRSVLMFSGHADSYDQGGPVR